MKNIHFDQKVFSYMEFPLKKLIELNAKTIQGISYIKPGELFTMKKPEEFLERNMNMFIQNSHMALDYIHDAFHLLENHWLNVSRRTEDTTNEVMRQSFSVIQKAEKNSSKKNAAKAKSAAKVSTKPVAKTSVKKNVKAAKPVVQHSKPAMAHAAKVRQQDVLATDKAKQSHGEAKEVGHHMPEVAAMTETGGVKDLGLLNKGRIIPG